MGIYWKPYHLGRNNLIERIHASFLCSSPGYFAGRANDWYGLSWIVSHGTSCALALKKGGTDLTALKCPYPAELLLVARRVAWYEKPEEVFSHLASFIAQVMAYGSVADVRVAQQFIPEEHFQLVLKRAPAGVFTIDSWERWHKRLGIEPVRLLSRRIFPDGTRGPVAGGFFGR